MNKINLVIPTGEITSESKISTYPGVALVVDAFLNSEKPCSIFCVSALRHSVTAISDDNWRVGDTI